jgi:DNA-binding NarL/FixJ family response regulator
MDLTMPRLDGRSAAKEILATDPGARIILTSGFPASSSEQTPLDSHLSGFIQKPYEMVDLLAELRRVIRSR